MWQETQPKNCNVLVHHNSAKPFGVHNLKWISMCLLSKILVIYYGKISLFYVISNYKNNYDEWFFIIFSFVDKIQNWCDNLQAF